VTVKTQSWAALAYVTPGAPMPYSPNFGCHTEVYADGGATPVEPVVV